MINFTILVAILGLLAIGFYCLLATRNLLKLVVSLQILIKSAMIAMILAGNLSGNMDLAQSMVVTIIVADTIVTVICLAMCIQSREKTGTSNIRAISKLRK